MLSAIEEPFPVTAWTGLSSENLRVGGGGIDLGLRTFAALPFRGGTTSTLGLRDAT